MNLTKRIKHIFRSTASGISPINHATLTIKDTYDLIPEAKGKSVADIMHRLEREGVLAKFFTRNEKNEPMHKYIINTDSGIPLWKLINNLSRVINKHGTMMVYSDRPIKFEVVDSGDINYMLIEGK